MGSGVYHITNEAKEDEWWKKFRYKNKEQAIIVIQQVRTIMHPLQSGDLDFYNYVLPILNTKSLWKKATPHVKHKVVQCIMDARKELTTNKLAIVPDLQYNLHYK